MYKRQGCTRTIIKSSTADKWRIYYKMGDPTILLMASGQRMQVDGSVKMKAEGNVIYVSVDALVSEPSRMRCWSAIKT